MRPRHERLAEQIRLTELLPAAKAELVRYPGVRDVGVGLKEVNDRVTEEIVFRVYVSEKKSPSELATGMIPKLIRGVPTDVVLESAPHETEDHDKYRPLLGGIQIGNDSNSVRGTLGCLAQRNSDKSMVLLSNKHVMLADTAIAGEKIGQPSISCCCCCKGNIVGEVLDSGYDALVDCAIAKIKGQPGFLNEIQDIGPIFGSASIIAASGSTVTLGDKVRKRGCATGLTTGTVTNVSKATPAGIEPDKNSPARTNQIEVKADPGQEWFQFDGDSGAVLVNEANVVVGLMWGVDKVSKLAYANRITDVLTKLDIKIVESGTLGTIPLGASPSAEEVAALDVADAPLSEITAVLERSPKGRQLLELFDRHGDEINELLNTNREVKVAWHRFHGPEFTAHIIESARERDHAIPAKIEGVSPANLLIRMSVVLQDNGSPALAAVVEANTLPTLKLFAATKTVHELLEHFDASDEELQAAGSTSTELI